MTNVRYRLITPADIGVILFILFVPKFKYKIKILIGLLIIGAGILLVDRIRGEPDTVKALIRIDPLPQARLLVAQKRYAEAHEYLAFFMDYDYVRSNPEAFMLYQDITAKRQTYLYRLKKLTEGIVWGKSDELEGQISAIVSDFFVIGDVRDLTLEGLKWVNGEEVDAFTAALSTIGLAATAGAWLSAGSTLSAKPAVSFLKMADKTGDVPNWVRKDIIRSARIIKKTKKLDNVTDLLDNVHSLVKTTGVRNTLVLLDKAEDAKALKKMTAFGKTFGKQSGTVLEITGDTGLSLFHTMEHVPRSVLLEAATCGEDGLRTLHKIGPERFQKLLKATKFAARTTKVAYKHRTFLLNTTLDVLRRFFGQLPTWVLIVIIVYGSILIIRR